MYLGKGRHRLFPGCPDGTWSKAFKGTYEGYTGGLYRYFGFCDCHAEGFYGISECGDP